MEYDFIRANNYIELSLNECGKEQCNPKKKFSFRVKQYHLFHYVVSGKGTFLLNNIPYPIHEGMIFYVPPGSHPIYYPDYKKPWTYIWLGFDGTSAKKFLKEVHCDEVSPIIVDKKKELLPYFEKIYEEYHQVGFLDLDCLGSAYQMFQKMMQIFSKREFVQDISSKEGYVRAARYYIYNNYQLDIRIEDIAKSIGVTPNYLANIFTEIQHVSPKRFLIDVRLEKAKLMLETGRYKICEVSNSVGYKNQLHFSNEFKKKYGKAPSAFLPQNSTEQKVV